MDSDYHLFESNNDKKDSEKNKNQKDHSPAYYKFVNQFRNHLKKIENDNAGEDITKLENHFNFINKYENEFEEQRENCINCYHAMKEQISLIEKSIPNFDVNVFNTFFQTFEEYYSFFEKALDVLKTFSQFNDETQELYYICKRKNYYIDALKDFFDKISVEYADKNEEYEDLRNKFKNLSESYDKLFKIYQESKSNDLKQYENIDNKELMIQQLNQKIQDLKIENDRYKSKYNECSKDLEAMRMVLKFKYVLKAESEKNIDYLKFRIQKYENDNSTLKKTLKELQKENENLVKDKEFLEEQINSNLNNMRTSEDKSNYASLIEENEEKEENDEKEVKEEKEKKIEEKESDKEVSDLEEYQTGNLGELLNDCEEVETEEEPKPEDKKDIDTTNENTNVEQKNENNQNDNNNANNELKDTLISVNEDKDKDKEKDAKKNVTFNVNDEEKKNIARKKIKGSIRLKHAGSVKIRIKKGISGTVNSAYNVMFQGKQFQFPSRVANKKNVDYFKQFFFLLFQAMKINSDKVQLFLGFDPESLYNQCKSEHVPFHKYQKWLETQLMRREQINDERKYEDFATLTGIFCSSLI